MALNLFGGGKPDNPMADVGHVKKAIAGLPANDFVKALTDIAVWLDMVNCDSGLALNRRFEIIDLLDAAARQPYRKLNVDYQSAQRLQKFQENTLWSAASEFAKQLGAAYDRCIEQLWSDAAALGSVRKELPVIVARALRALTRQMKWTQLRYGQIDAPVWGAIGRLYFFAETKGICTEVLKIYPDEEGDGTVQVEFLKAVILGISSNNGLDPAQQEIAARAVVHFRSMYVLQQEPALGCNFCFDLARQEPPVRVTKDYVPGKTLRCFGAGRAVAALSALTRDIQQQDRVPAEVGAVGAGFDTDLVLSALRHLALQWAEEPPARQSERRRIATRLTILHGFAELLRATESTMDAASLDFEHAAGLERWIVENVSERGFGAIIPPVQGDWIKVGALLGVQTEASTAWGAGILRRIVRDESRQRRVGIQLLSKTAIPVKLVPVGAVAAGNAAPVGESALLLSTKPDKDGEVSLLLRSHSSMRDHPLEMNVRDKRYHLTPRSLVEGREDFDWVRFKVTARAG